VSEAFSEDPADIGIFFEGQQLRTENNGFATLRTFSGPVIDARTSPRRTVDDFPTLLVDTVRNRGAGSEFATIGGDEYVAVGLHLAKHDAGYFEAFPVEGTTTTLTAILTALALGAAGTLVLATLFGFSTSRRLLQPLSSVADAAEDIASGGLDTRLEAESDPDLARLARSFNDMADAVQARIEREARFASDVSHELRSPITALTAAIEVHDARRDELPERTRQALDVVVSQVRRFDAMVIDLLELSRIDAGASDLNLEQLDIVDLVERITARHGPADLEIDVPRGFNVSVSLDKVRFERILGNLIDNAVNHGDGAIAVKLANARRGSFRVVVEDDGPGVARGERERIFERFARGSAARHRVGSGLGLALVREHAEAMGGSTWVEDRAGGGARFVVELPRRVPPQRPGGADAEVTRFEARQVLSP
jgi:signal transduction histidine kinase